MSSHSGSVSKAKAREIRKWVGAHKGFSVGVDVSEGDNAYLTVDIANGASDDDRKAFFKLFNP